MFKVHKKHVAAADSPVIGTAIPPESTFTVDSFMLINNDVNACMTVQVNSVMGQGSLFSCIDPAAGGDIDH